MEEFTEGALPVRSEPVEQTRRVEAVVVALIPEYHQARVRDREGGSFALTRATPGST